MDKEDKGRVELAEFKLGLIAPVVNRTFPDPSQAEYFCRVASEPVEHMALLLIVRGTPAIGIELYVPDDKEIGRKAIGNKALFEEALGLKAEPFEASKASGLRFFSCGKDFREDTGKWYEYIQWHLEKAVKLYDVVKELGL